ncbi:L-threonylcarbamoyladenylate synthase [Kocuria rhizophila]|uniref:L-threonylcarbamoyladenylate synthase n=1 Tax=Kocuria rhizophila TaxID=72000 RepID=UPI00068DF2B3|nr:L-threonylcarbamoyladenylate synthase [Kocuria rhizophila]
MSEILPCGTEEERETAVARAAEVVADGECLVLPTDTVYGIGCDAFSAPGVQGLLGAKGRTREMPPPVLIARPEVMEALADQVSEDARALAEAFWPGALTLVCWAQPSLGWDLGETHGTVALRVPDDAAARAVLERVGPMAVSSANRTGMPAARTAQAAQDMLQERVPLYLDDGPRPVEEPAEDARDAASTIVDCTGETPVVLRHGAISLQRLREVVPAVHSGGRDDAATQATAQRPSATGGDDRAHQDSATGGADSAASSAQDGEEPALRNGVEPTGAVAAGLAGSAVRTGRPASVREEGEEGDGTPDDELITAMVWDGPSQDARPVDQVRDRNHRDEPRWGGTSALSMADAERLVADDTRDPRA